MCYFLGLPTEVSSRAASDGRLLCRRAGRDRVIDVSTVDTKTGQERCWEKRSPGLTNNRDLVNV